MEEMDERDFLKTINAYTTIQRLLGVIEGASAGLENEKASGIIGDAAAHIGDLLEDVFSLVQVIDEDDEA